MSEIFILRGEKVVKKWKYVLFTAILISLFCQVMPVNAKNYSSVRITQADQVVDTMTLNGKTIQSRYTNTSDRFNDSHPTYCCAALIKNYRQN